jgi:hypothetical protein
MHENALRRASKGPQGESNPPKNGGFAAIGAILFALPAAALASIAAVGAPGPIDWGAMWDSPFQGVFYAFIAMYIVGYSLYRVFFRRKRSSLTARAA